MTGTSNPPSRQRFAGLRLSAVAFAIVAIALAVLSAKRVWLAAVQPLWFDEAWTAQIAATPNWSTFTRDVFNDIQAPLYYLTMRLWAAVAGVSDFALRAPALIALTAAGAIPTFGKIKGLSRESRLTWGVLIFAWWGVGLFLSGRGYALLLAVSTAQCVIFAQLLDKPTSANAWRWSGLACVAILTHYLAGIAVAAQGLIYLLSRRERALRTWPALLAFAPAAAWMFYHGPRLAEFSGMQAWHPFVTAPAVVRLVGWAIAPLTPWMPAAVGLVLIGALLKPRNAATDEPDAVAVPHLWLAVGAAALGLGLMLILGAIKPVLTPRYLIPMVPGLLLGLVLLARRSAYAPWIYFSLMAIYLGAALRPGALQEIILQRVPYGYEGGSTTLMRHGVHHLVFVWDHPAARFEHPDSMQRVAAVFFQRAGRPVAVTVIAPTEAQDANSLALAAATPPHSGIIWLYDRSSVTSAQRFPPRISEVDPRWTCEREGDATIGTLTCYR